MSKYETNKYMIKAAIDYSNEIHKSYDWALSALMKCQHQSERFSIIRQHRYTCRNRWENLVFECRNQPGVAGHLSHGLAHQLDNNVLDN